jgi:hypothetical protein
MTRVDERIREEMQRLGQAVDPEGVLERVAGKRSRRRLLRRVQATALAVAVVGGSVAGGVGLTHLFGHQATTTTTPATEPSLTPSGPNPTSAGGSDGAGGGEPAMCDHSQLNADVDGDGVLDQVDLWSPAPTCHSPEVGQRWVLHVSGGKLGPSGPGVRFYGAEQDFPDCQQPDACRLFAAPDVNGDGKAELAVQVVSGASTEFFALYELEEIDTAAGPRFFRIDVAAPGDPWNDQFGLMPGPGLFAWGGSVTNLHGATCVDRSGLHDFVLRTGLPSTATADAYDVHDTFLHLDAGTLSVVGTNDVVVSSQYPLVPQDLCGAPIDSANP